MNLELIATAAFGLEAVVKRELEKLECEVLKTEDGKITFKGDERTLVRSNLWLRAADRVYVKMGEFDAVIFDELFENIKALDWEKIIPKDGRIVVNGSSVKSLLHSVPACQSICNKAIADKLMKAYGIDRLPETGALFEIRFAILKDRVTVGIDASGAGLHKRGYRVKDVAAPIKETMAAALVELSFWNKDRVLLDPCCGSGTIAIEAALIGRNIAPGLSRKFVSEDWPLVPKNIWKEEREKAYKEIDEETELKIYASDINPSAVEAAKENAEEAGVIDDIVFSVEDAGSLFRKEEKGIIITNPPYGERIGDQKEIEKIYSGLRNFLKKKPFWSLFMITGDKGGELKAGGRKADRRRKLYNGRIEVCYYQFHGEK